jgi:hypothetical protein
MLEEMWPIFFGPLLRMIHGAVIHDDGIQTKRPHLFQNRADPFFGIIGGDQDTDFIQ